MRRTKEQMEKERLKLEKVFNQGYNNAFYIITLLINSKKTFREFFTERGAEKDMYEIKVWKSLAVALGREDEMLEFLYGDEVKEIKKRVDEKEMKKLMKLWNMPRHGVIKVISELREGADGVRQLSNKGEKK